MPSTAIAESRRVPSPKLTPKRLHVFVAIVLLAIYFVVIWHNFHEARLRTVNLAIPSHSDEHMLMDVNVVSVDLSRLEMTARISFAVTGKLAQDEVTPATDLQVVLNTVRGQQQINFPTGKRMNTVDAVFPLQGEINRYPLDRYKGSVWLLVTLSEQHHAPLPTLEPKPKPAPATKADSNSPTAQLPLQWCHLTHHR